MRFKESKYYDKNFLGKQLHEDIEDGSEIFTVQEYFNINTAENKYKIVNEYGDYKLTIENNYYELNCQGYNIDLYLVFDKPVHVVGAYCVNIIAPEIIVKNSRGHFLSRCVANEVVINNKLNHNYEIFHSKVNSIYFYNANAKLLKAQINNFFIFNEDLRFSNISIFLDGLKIKCFGVCTDLKEKMLNNRNFKEGIIHIE